MTLLALTNAYRALANGGAVRARGAAQRRRAGEAGARRRRRRRCSSSPTSWPTTTPACGTFGLDSALATRGFAAVKTGTSKDMRDNWCIGFTDRYTVGVWVGNASGEAMHDVSGVSGAAPVWQALVSALHARPSSKPPARAGRRDAGIGSRSTGNASRRATRSSSPAPSARCSARPPRSTGARRFGITSPRDGSVFAIDPDIPPAAQRITFEGEHGRWVLDGKRARRGGERWRWAPWPGRHRLVLVGRDGQALQSVRFEVRGAGVKAEARPPAARGSAPSQPVPVAATRSAKPALPAPAKPAS